jgi:Tol biopolymer transport system component
MNADGSGQRLVGRSGRSSLTPSWSPDGRILVYRNQDDADLILHTVCVDTGEDRALTSASHTPAFASDGSHILFQKSSGYRGVVKAINLDGSGLQGLTCTVDGSAGRPLPRPR